MDRVFLDANVLFSAAYRSNSGLLRLWALEDCALYSSRYAIAEVAANLDEDSQRERLDNLCKTLTLVDAVSIKLPHGIVLPEKDVPILAAAIKADASHLLTGDVRHFGRYLGRRISGVLVQLPGEYLKAR